MWWLHNSVIVLKMIKLMNLLDEWTVLCMNYILIKLFD